MKSIHRLFIVSMLLVICGIFINSSHYVQAVPKPTQLIQMNLEKNLYVLWSGYDNSTQHNAVVLSTSQDGGSSFKVNDLTKFGIGSADKMEASNGNIYLISKNTITKSNNDGNSFGNPIVLNGNGNSVISNLVTSGDYIYALIDDVINDGNSFQILSSVSNDGGNTFSKPSKLFGMPEASEDYAQITAVENNVYVIAEGKYGGVQGPVGVLFKKSNDGGNTFGNTIDLTNDNSTDYAPKIAANGTNVYVVWSELGSKGTQLYFRSSHDYGKTFDSPIKLSKEPDFGTMDSDFPKLLAVNNDTVYVVWWGIHFQNQTETDDLLFRKSDDGGQTFGDVIKLSGNKTSPEDIGHNTAISASGKNVYAVWVSYFDVQSVTNVGVVFTKSNDGGNTFGKTINLNTGGAAQSPQISASGNEVYVAWDTGKNNNEISIEKSSDAGATFSPVTGFDTTNDLKTKYLPPLRQIKNGIDVHDIKCNAGLELILNAKNGKPACVKQETASNLILRGWTLNVNTSQTPNQNSKSMSYGPDFKLGPDILGPVPHRLVFFMNANSSAKIFVEYTSDEPNTGTTKSYASVYTGKTNYTPLTTSDVAITAYPDVIPITKGSNTTIVYTITAKDGVKGIYWISLAQICGVMPIAIDFSNPSPSDIPVPMGAIHCPAQFLNAKILGITGGTAEYRIGEPVQ